MSLAPLKDAKVTPDSIVGNDYLAGQALCSSFWGAEVPHQALIFQDYVGDESPGKAKFRLYPWTVT